MKTKFKETEIGRIPEEWGLVKVRDIALINEAMVNKVYPYPEIEYYNASIYSSKGIY